MSRQPVPWRTLSKLGVFVVVAVLATVIVASSLLNLSSQPQNAYSALFTNASGLQPGDFVDIAGVQVGAVNSVRLQGTRALVTFTTDVNQPLTTTTRVNIDYANLLGQQLLSLAPGPGQGHPLPPGAQIPPSRTAPALDLTSIFNGFQPLFAALTPQQVNQLTASIIQIFQGESGTVDSLVTQTASLTENLAQRQQLIGQVIDNLSSVAGTLDSHDQQLVTMINQFDGLVSGLAGERAQIGATVDSLSGLTNAVSNLLNQSQPTLNEALDSLVSASQTAANDQSGFDGVLTNLPDFIAALDRVADSGSFLNVYLCNLTIKVQGTLNLNVITGQPGVPITVPSGPVGDQRIHTANCQ
jgi:phospholipid/cholesterol/gamma-HCH transport system substrate-binding protein